MKKRSPWFFDSLLFHFDHSLVVVCNVRRWFGLVRQKYSSLFCFEKVSNFEGKKNKKQKDHQMWPHTWSETINPKKEKKKKSIQIRIHDLSSFQKMVWQPRKFPNNPPKKRNKFAGTVYKFIYSIWDLTPLINRPFFF